MKKLLFSLLFVALSTMTFAQQWTSISKSSVNAEPAGPEVTLISSSEKQVVVDFSIGGFYLTSVSTPNGTQQIVSVPKMAPMLTAGAPDLPQFPVPAIIGDLAEMEVSILKSEFTDYQNVEIAPSKGNLSRQVDPKNVPYTYGPMYSQDAFYPEAQASLDAPYILRDFRGQNIMVKPFTWPKHHGEAFHLQPDDQDASCLSQPDHCHAQGERQRREPKTQPQTLWQVGS